VFSVRYSNLSLTVCTAIISEKSHCHSKEKESTWVICVKSRKVERLLSKGLWVWKYVKCAMICLPLQPRNMYPNNMYQYQPKASPPASTANNYPVHPDVRLKRLPFFDLMGELLKPSSLGRQIVYIIFEFKCDLKHCCNGLSHEKKCILCEILFFV
jgi:hypothetical protein